jgi:hypothetical protein
MVRAAVNHGFDFTSYDPRSIMHRQKLRLYKSQIRKDDDARLAEWEARRHLGVYLSRGFEAPNRTDAYTHFQSAVQRIEATLRPGVVPIETGDIVSRMEQEYAEAVASGEIRGGPVPADKA